MIVAIKLYKEPTWSVPGYYIDVLSWPSDGYRAARKTVHVDSLEEALIWADARPWVELQDMTNQDSVSKGD